MSADLCSVVITITQQLMIHGETITTTRGVPLCVKQDEVKKKGELKIVRNTVKVAVF